MEKLTQLNTCYLVAEVELIYRTKVKASDRPQVKTSGDAHQILLQHWDKNKLEFIEQFKILLLNRNNKVLAVYDMSTGGVTGTFVDAKIIFTAALKANACGIILSHNHPSGNLKPSKADIDLTIKLKTAGKYLDIDILDHIIVTDEGYYSLADEGGL